MWVAERKGGRWETDRRQGWPLTLRTSWSADTHCTDPEMSVTVPSASTATVRTGKTTALPVSTAVFSSSESCGKPRRVSRLGRGTLHEGGTQVGSRTVDSRPELQHFPLVSFCSLSSRDTVAMAGMPAACWRLKRLTIP